MDDLTAVITALVALFTAVVSAIGVYFKAAAVRYEIVLAEKKYNIAAIEAQEKGTPLPTPAKFEKPSNLRLSLWTFGLIIGALVAVSVSIIYIVKTSSLDYWLERSDPLLFDGHASSYFIGRVFPDRPVLFDQSRLGEVIRNTGCTFDMFSVEGAVFGSSQYGGEFERLVKGGKRVRLLMASPSSDFLDGLASVQNRNEEGRNDLRSAVNLSANKVEQLVKSIEGTNPQGSIEACLTSRPLLYEGWVRDGGDCEDSKRSPMAHFGVLSYLLGNQKGPGEMAVRFGSGAGETTRYIQREFDHLWDLCISDTIGAGAPDHAGRTPPNGG